MLEILSTSLGFVSASLVALIALGFGLMFVFFVFSMIASGVNEVISRFTTRRARFLERGVWRMLGGQLGTVRVDMTKAVINAAAAKAGWFLFAIFGAVALGACAKLGTEASRLSASAAAPAPAGERREGRSVRGMFV